MAISAQLVGNGHADAATAARGHASDGADGTDGADGSNGSDGAAAGSRHAWDGDDASDARGLLLGAPSAGTLPRLARRPCRRRYVRPLPPHRAHARGARGGPLRGVEGGLQPPAGRGAGAHGAPRGEDGAGVLGDAGCDVVQRRRPPRRRRRTRDRVPPRAERRVPPSDYG